MASTWSLKGSLVFMSWLVRAFDFSRATCLQAKSARLINWAVILRNKSGFQVVCSLRLSVSDFKGKLNMHSAHRGNQPVLQK